MLNLRCMSINEKWDEYNQFHIDQEHKRLYADTQCINQESWPSALAA